MRRAEAKHDTDLWFVGDDGCVPSSLAPFGGGSCVADEAMQQVFEEPRGRHRRGALLGLLASRLRRANEQTEALLSRAAGSRDRLAARLVEQLEALGEGGIWEAFRVIGAVRGDLVGKRSQPNGQAAGMRAVRRDGLADGELIRGESAVLEHVQHLSARIFSECGGSVSGVVQLLDMLGCGDGAGDATEDGSDDAGGGAAATGDGSGADGNSEIEAMLSQARFDAALASQEKSKGVGVDQFSGYWLRLAPREVRGRYLCGMREVARDIVRRLPASGVRTTAQAREHAEGTRSAAPTAWTEWVAPSSPPIQPDV